MYIVKGRLDNSTCTILKSDSQEDENLEEVTRVISKQRNVARERRLRRVAANTL